GGAQLLRQRPHALRGHPAAAPVPALRRSPALDRLRQPREREGVRQRAGGHDPRRRPHGDRAGHAEGDLPGTEDRLTRPRGVVVVTGSELVRGERTDRNGPFLAAELMRLGIEPARIAIVGDGAAELEAALREGLEADLCVVSGGLGPTHDDRTVQMVARAAGLAVVVDPALEAEIEAFSRGIAARLNRPYADFEAGVRKQA